MPEKLPLIINVSPSRPPTTIVEVDGTPTIQCEVKLEGGEGLLCLTWNAAEALQKLLSEQLKSRRMEPSGPAAKL